jgi:DNA-directed RNA polymerase specialized sigma24 family protein
VVQKVPEIAPTYQGNPEFYFYSVIKFVVLRWLRRSQSVELHETDHPPASADDSPDVERRHACLDRCLAGLDDLSRELALEYYRHDKKAKINHRWALAQRVGVSLNALRIKALRIRQSLEVCVQRCVNE